jgi:hypothetical protein
MKKSTLSLLTFVALFGVATGCASTARTAEGKGRQQGWDRNTKRAGEKRRGWDNQAKLARRGRSALHEGDEDCHLQRQLRVSL